MTPVQGWVGPRLTDLSLQTRLTPFYTWKVGRTASKTDSLGVPVPCRHAEVDVKWNRPRIPHGLRPRPLLRPPRVTTRILKQDRDDSSESAHPHPTIRSSQTSFPPLATPGSVFSTFDPVDRYSHGRLFPRNLGGVRPPRPLPLLRHHLGSLRRTLSPLHSSLYFVPLLYFLIHVFPVFRALAGPAYLRSKYLCECRFLRGGPGLRVVHVGGSFRLPCDPTFPGDTGHQERTVGGVDGG